MDRDPRRGIGEVIDFFNKMQRHESDRVVFTDPTTGENIAADKPPTFLSRDKKLKDGYQFLSEFGHLINLDVVLARHGNEDEASLGDERFGFETRVQNSDIYLMEGLGYTEQTEAILNKLSRTGKADEEVKDWIGQSLHRLRQAQAIQGSKVSVGFFDIDNHSDENNIRKELIGVSELYDLVEFDGDEKGKNKLEWIHALALESMREWFMVGNIGHSIALKSQEDPKLLQKLSEGKIKVMLTAGESHGDLVRKLRPYGMNLTESRPVPNRHNNLQSQMFPKWMEQGYVSKKDLERLVND